MADDLSSTLKQAIDALQASEQQVATLKQQLAKQASMVADKSLVAQTVAALKKIGSITEQEAAEAQQLLSSDPNAALRCINGLVTAQEHYRKTASAEQADVSGAGHLVGESTMTKQAKHEDTLLKVHRILNHETY